MQQPNILLIMADQLGACWTGVGGHPVVKTPHLDALGREGVVFERAYCNSPICAPSRASFCTGQLLARLGVFDNGGDFPAATPTFMHHLRRAGYQTLLAGKMHFIGPDQLHGFQRRLTPEIYPSTFAWTADWSNGVGPNPGSNVRQLLNAGTCDWSMQLDYDELVAFRSLEALRELARHRDRPFCLCASFTHPHEPFIITRNWWDLYHEDDIKLPLPSPAGRPLHPFNEWLQTHNMADAVDLTAQHVRSARRAYYGMVSYFDDKIGQLMHELDRLDLADRTIVIITSDHGEMLGEKGMWFKRTWFDQSTRVPLVVWNPEWMVAGHRVDQAVSLIDLYPTLLAIAGLEDLDSVADDIDGQSLLAALQGRPHELRDYAVCEYYGEGVVQPMRMVVGRQLKYVYVHEHAPVLYDLQRDPEETTNMIDDPAYAQDLIQLKRLLHDRWDPALMQTEVLASQRRRLWVHQAMQGGGCEQWDVVPHFDPAVQFVRTHDSQYTNALLRVPRIDG